MIAPAKRIAPSAVMAANCPQRMDKSTPLRKTPLMMTRKYLRGFRQVNHCTTKGMLAMGKTKPLSMKKGRMKKKVVIMACCWVEEMVEIKSPTPRGLKRKKQEATKSRATLPARGRLNQKRAKRVTATIWVRGVMM